MATRPTRAVLPARRVAPPHRAQQGCTPFCLRKLLAQPRDRVFDTADASAGRIARRTSCWFNIGYSMAAIASRGARCRMPTKIIPTPMRLTQVQTLLRLGQAAGSALRRTRPGRKYSGIIISRMADDGFDELRRSQRREYSRRHAKARRAADRDQGGRRIDVTLKNEMREDYETVRDWPRRRQSPQHRRAPAFGSAASSVGYRGDQDGAPSRGDAYTRRGKGR